MKENDSNLLPLFDSVSGSPGEQQGVALLTGAPLAFLILGPPGAGKGTQAGLLSERLGLPHVSTGDMLRDRILVGDDLGRRIAERIEIGQFVPDDWINQLLDERMAHPDCHRGVILDGYPRTMPQAERLKRRLGELGFLSVVAQLLAGEEMLAGRFAGRRQCSECLALFHLEFQPSLSGDRCDRPGCQGWLHVRADDSPEFIRRRLADFERLTEPVIASLALSASALVAVDAGEGTPEEIHNRILTGVVGAFKSGPRGSLGEGAQLFETKLTDG